MVPTTRVLRRGSKVPGDVATHRSGMEILVIAVSIAKGVYFMGAYKVVPWKQTLMLEPKFVFLISYSTTKLQIAAEDRRCYSILHIQYE